ncbi:hypothetical protein PRIC1_006108 [Phytophthora ramorum]
MAAVLPAASLHVQTADPIPAAKKRPLSPTRLLDEVPEVSADDLKTPTARPPTSSSVSPKSVAISAINPHDLKLLKVIGRGTFARQVALARHCETQSMYVVKTLDKSKLLQRKQVVHTLTEKRVLERLDGHPFIVKLYSAFQTDRDLNFVLEYCQGGELFFHLQQQFSQKFEENAARFYAAEVLAALSELHTNGVVYRDLKPENVLLDAQGHVKLADFGFAKQDMSPSQRTYSFCGSPEYLSPEMVKKDGHGIETDMWSFGCFIYELLTGHAMSLLKGLLCVNPVSRLTAAQAMDHPFFKLSLNWDELFQRQVTPPIVPVCHGRDSTDNFDDDFTNAPVVSLKLQSGDFVKRVRLDDCSGPVTDSARADEFQDF